MKQFGDSSYESTDCFTHAPLDHQEPSIRLIRILSNLSKHSRIQCEIRHASIYDAYYCLSYVWGPKENLRSIEINNKAYAIRSNLFSFLDNARRKPHFLQRWLWIDALCINQEDDRERVHQVQQMGDIYSNAVGVVSWLGPCERIAAFLQDPSDKKIHSTTEFYASEYWNRAWITQELALARCVTFMALDAEVDRRVVPFEYHRELRRPSSRRNTIISENSREVKGRSLFFLLDLTKMKYCEVTRDSVFSLLSLSGDGVLVAVDYSSQHILLASHILRSCSETFCLCSL
ncbi:heterokaryon incompatibility protein-domain-containing protein, partial [Paraphoma chrysanthemicola]